jgi:hypothetical protein
MTYAIKYQEMKPTEVSPLRKLVSEWVPPEDGDRMQSPKCVLNKRHDDG